MQNACGFAHHLHHIQIAIGVERIARIIRCEGDGNAARLHFMHKGHAPPTRRAPRLAILQIHIAHGQDHNRNAGISAGLDGFQREFICLTRE